MRKKYLVKPFGASITGPMTCAFRTRMGALRYARKLKSIGIETSIGRVLS